MAVATAVAGCGAIDLAHAEPAFSAQASQLELSCQLRYASDTRMLHQPATPDPYAAATVDFENRFRFRAVVLGTGMHIEHVTLTVYELAEGEGSPPVIIHQARHQAPFNQGMAIPALTGWNHVYASGIGREFRYGCALRPVGLVESNKAVAP